MTQLPDTIASKTGWLSRPVSVLGLGAIEDADYLAQVLPEYMARGGNVVDAQHCELAIPKLEAHEGLVVCVQSGLLPADPRPLLREGVLEAEDMVANYCLAPAFLRQQLHHSLATLQRPSVSVFWLEGVDEILAATSETDLRFRLREAFAALEVAVAQKQIEAYGLALKSPSFPTALALEVAQDVLGELHHFCALKYPTGEVCQPDGTFITHIISASQVQLPPNRPLTQQRSIKMKEFFTVLPPAEALAHLFKHLPPRAEPETISIAGALERVTAAPVRAPVSVPAFPRSIMDGYAVRAQDTFGASQTLPMYLELIGEVPMGQEPHFSLRAGTCALVHTGGMLPPGADAVVMMELTQTAREDEIEILKAAAPGENILRVGDDILEGAEMLAAGHSLRAQDLGGLAALGITQIQVARAPRVALLATGDEVVPPDVEPQLGQVRDVNSYAVAGQIERAGGAAVRAGIAPDNYAELKRMAAHALAEADMLVLSAGSSVSVRDMTAEVINELGEPGVLVHGVALKPGKPAILAVCDGKPVIGLPGNPVSAMVVADLFVVPAVYR
ncbi:MAG: hypothetical protein JNL09_10160, partial [Anaerolineales bacterium]|nr:hypothetical protein [Anaerolineales bacterium]